MIALKIKNSFLAISAGWSAGMLLILFEVVSNSIHDGPPNGAMSLTNSGAIYIPVFAVSMITVLLPIWFFLLLPLTIFVPDKSFLWKPGSLGLIGIFIGPIICGAYQISNFAYARAHTDLRVHEPPFTYILHMFNPFGFMSAFIGFVTCFMSAKLHERLMQNAGRLDNDKEQR